MLVLLVEDDDDIRESLAALLRQMGIEVATASDGADALLQLKSGLRPGLLLVDLMMPIVNGWELIHRVRGSSRWDNVRIVVMSATPDQAPSGYPVLRKPIDMDALVAVLNG